MRVLERRKTVEQVDTEGSWAISYGDMITLLLSFFVLYFTVDPQKIRAEKIENALMARLKETGIKAPEEAIKDQLNVGVKPGSGVDPQVADRLGAQVYQMGNRMLIDFPDTEFFKLGRVDLTKDGEKALEKFAATYIPFASTHQLNLQAFTDTRKVLNDNPRFKDNLELSALRSVAAMRILQRAGVPLDRMKIAGYGELVETQENLMKLQKETDPLKFTRKVIVAIEPKKVGN